MNIIRITPDTYLNLATVAYIHLRGFKEGAAPVLNAKRTLTIGFIGGGELAFVAAEADAVRKTLSDDAGIALG